MAQKKRINKQAVSRRRPAAILSVVVMLVLALAMLAASQVQAATIPCAVGTTTMKMLKQVGVFAGSSTTPGSADGAVESATFSNPQWLSLSGNTLYVAEGGGRRIRAISSGQVSTLADFSGDGYFPAGLARLSTGELLVGRSTGLCQVNAFKGGVSSRWAGTGLCSLQDGDRLTTARFDSIQNMVVDSMDNVYLLEGNNNGETSTGASLLLMRVISNTTRAVTTLKETSIPFASNWYQFDRQTGTGDFYIASRQTHQIWRISANGATVTAVAGVNGVAGGDDGPAASATFNTPIGAFFIESSNFLVVTERGGNRVRLIDMSTNQVCTLGGSADSTSGFSNTVDGSLFNVPSGIAYDRNNARILVADYGNNVVRSLDLAFVGATPATLLPANTGQSVELQSALSLFVDTTGDSNAFWLATSTGSCAVATANPAPGTSAKLTTFTNAKRMTLTVATKVNETAAASDTYRLCARWASTATAYTELARLSMGNNPPTAVKLSTASYSAPGVANAAVGVLSTIDVDPPSLDTWTYTLRDGAVDAFTIDGNTLRLANNNESRSPLVVTIRSTDKAGAYTDATFTITAALSVSISSFTLSNPSMSSMDVTVAAAAAPPAQYTNPRFEFVVAGNAFAPGYILPTNPGVCAWSDNKAVKCTIANLSAATKFSIDARLATDQLASVPTTSSNEVWTLISATVNTDLYATNPTPNSLVIKLRATLDPPKTGGHTNLRFEFIPMGLDFVPANMMTVSPPCAWEDTNWQSCTIVGLTPATGYQFQARCASDQSAGNASPASPLSYTSLLQTISTINVTAGSNGLSAVAVVKPSGAPPAGVTNRRFQFVTSAASDFTVPANIISTAPTVCGWLDASTVTCTLTGLASGTLYSFRSRLASDQASSVPSTASTAIYTLIAESVSSITAGSPTLDSLVVTVTPSGAPPTGLTNTRVELVMNGQSFDTQLLPTTPTTCAWRDASPIACTISGLTDSTGYRFQARLMSAETTPATVSSPSAISYTMMPHTVTSVVLSNPTSDSLTAAVTASAAPPGGAFTNARFEFFVAGATPGVDAPLATTPSVCSWSSTSTTSCVVSGLLGGTSYRLQARVVTNQAVGALSTASTPLFTKFSMSVMSVSASAPAFADRVVVSIQPSGPPSPSLTSPLVQLVFSGGNPDDASQLLNTATPCTWSSGNPVQCTVTGLSPNTGYAFQARLSSAQTTGPLSAASATGYTLMDRTVVSLAASNPTVSTITVTVQASALPPAGLQNPRFEFTTQGASFANISDKLATTAPCLWQNANAVVCTLTALPDGTSHTLVARLRTDETYSSVSNPATAVFTLFSGVINTSTLVAKNPGTNSLEITVQASSAPPASQSNARFEFIVAGGSFASNKLVASPTCQWSDTSVRTCTLVGLSTASAYSVQARIATDQTVGIVSAASNTIFTLFSQTTTIVLADNPTATTVRVQVVPSAGPPVSGYTNARFEFVLANGNPNNPLELIATSPPCTWLTASPVTCTLTGLLAGTAQQFRARVRSDETAGALSSPSASITTLINKTVTGAVTANDGNTITIKFVPSAVSETADGSNPRIEVFASTNLSVALVPIAPNPCTWSAQSVSPVTCSFVSSGTSANTFQGRLRTDSNMSSLGTAFSSFLTTGFAPTEGRAGADLNNDIAIDGLNLSSNDQLRAIDEAATCQGTALDNSSKVSALQVVSTSLSGARHTVRISFTAAGQYKLCIRFNNVGPFVDVSGGLLKVTVPVVSSVTPSSVLASQSSASLVYSNVALTGTGFDSKDQVMIATTSDCAVPAPGVTVSAFSVNTSTRHEFTVASTSGGAFAVCFQPAGRATYSAVAGASLVIKGVVSMVSPKTMNAGETKMVVLTGYGLNSADQFFLSPVGGSCSAATSGFIVSLVPNASTSISATLSVSANTSGSFNLCASWSGVGAAESAGPTPALSVSAIISTVTPLTGSVGTSNTLTISGLGLLETFQVRSRPVSATSCTGSETTSVTISSPRLLSSEAKQLTVTATANAAESIKLCVLAHGTWTMIKEAVTFVTPPDTGARLVTVDTTTITAYGFRVSWQPPSNNASAVTGYSITVVAADGATRTIDQSLIGVSYSYTLTDLVPETTYNKISVFAWVGPVQIATPATYETPVKTTTAVPDAPSNVRLSPASTSVLLTWVAPARAGVKDSSTLAYSVQYRRSNGSTWLPQTPSELPGLSFSVTTLLSGAAYDFRVRARNAVGTGSWSAPVTVSTTASTAAIAAPVNLSVSQSPLVLAWAYGSDLASSVTAFSLSLSWTGGSRTFVVMGSTRRSYALTQLESDSVPDNVDVTFTVSAVVGTSASPSSDPFRFRKSSSAGLTVSLGDPSSPSGQFDVPVTTGTAYLSSGSSQTASYSITFEAGTLGSSGTVGITPFAGYPSNLPTLVNNMYTEPLGGFVVQSNTSGGIGTNNAQSVSSLAKKILSRATAQQQVRAGAVWAKPATLHLSVLHPLSAGNTAAANNSTDTSRVGAITAAMYVQQSDGSWAVPEKVCGGSQSYDGTTQTVVAPICGSGTYYLFRTSFTPVAVPTTGGDSKFPVWAVVGPIIAVVVVGAIAVGVWVLLRRRARRGQQKVDSNSSSNKSSTEPSPRAIRDFIAATPVVAAAGTGDGSNSPIFDAVNKIPDAAPLSSRGNGASTPRVASLTPRNGSGGAPNLVAVATSPNVAAAGSSITPRVNPGSASTPRGPLPSPRPSSTANSGGSMLSPRTPTSARHMPPSPPPLPLAPPPNADKWKTTPRPGQAGDMPLQESDSDEGRSAGVLSPRSQQARLRRQAEASGQLPPQPERERSERRKKSSSSSSSKRRSTSASRRKRHGEGEEETEAVKPADVDIDFGGSRHTSRGATTPLPGGALPMPADTSVDFDFDGPSRESTPVLHAGVGNTTPRSHHHHHHHHHHQHASSTVVDMDSRSGSPHHGSSSGTGSHASNEALLRGRASATTSQMDGAPHRDEMSDATERDVRTGNTLTPRQLPQNDVLAYEPYEFTGLTARTLPDEDSSRGSHHE